jgi:hypothetical protein
MTTAPTTQDQDQGTAAAAADQGKHLGGVAAGEAQSVAGDVKDQAQRLLDETKQQVNEQGAVQRDRLVELLRGLSHDLREMADHADGNSLAGQLVRQGADRAEGVRSSLDGREPADLVDEVRAFARRRPGAFLAGALLAGLAVGRFARGAKDSQSDEQSTRGTGPGQGWETSVPQPVTGPLDTSPAPVTPATTATTTATTTGAPTSASNGDPSFGDPYTAETP